MPATYDNDNIFAKILRGEVPSTRVLENEHVIAFMDLMPQGPGHTLVVPKAASRNLLDADPQVLAETIKAVQQIAIAVKKAFSADGVTIMQFNEPAAGQTVYHLHFHVIPRFDGIALKPHTGQMEDAETLAANAEKIKASI
ncbi:HIT family protein [Falsochrobactrum ovis]|uniref:Histidine triad (HIT) family protein n=1 Tax=Falsochrobactrum ovis TaxID=1293442 RepID=A0A364JXZ8_9HYPH|nr:HIT family protein [Falsochrobactrum ovis]RAK32333.1 histidine triad (HIT) family protein [Falsochrobactrum ovis]